MLNIRRRLLQAFHILNDVKDKKAHFDDWKKKCEKRNNSFDNKVYRISWGLYNGQRLFLKDELTKIKLMNEFYQKSQKFIYKNV